MKASHSKMDPLKVISFDLDNALYDNQPVLERAEALSAEFLKTEFLAQGRVFRVEQFSQIKLSLLASGDIRYENLSYSRQIALQQFCQPLQNNRTIADKAFQVFIQARSEVEIASEIYQLLCELKERYQLVSVSNGNCDPRRLSLALLFSGHYSASSGYRAKPHPQMLMKVLRDFGLRPDQLLHVGDSIEKDGVAASRADVAFYHFAPFQPTSDLACCCRRLSEYLIT